MTQRNCVINIEEAAAGGVKLVVATNFARRAVSSSGLRTAPSRPALASFARVAHIGNAKAREPHRSIRLQDGLDQQALQIEQPHVFITVTSKNYRMGFGTEHSLRFDRGREAIDGRLLDPQAKFIERISFASSRCTMPIVPRSIAERKKRVTVESR